MNQPAIKTRNIQSQEQFQSSYPFKRNNRIKIEWIEKNNTATKAAAVLVRWQVVLVFLSSPVALWSPSWGEEGAVSSFSVCTFLHPVDPVTGALCLGRATTTSYRPLSLYLSWNGHGQFTWRHTPKHRQSRREGAGLAEDPYLLSLFMRHTYPRARLRGEQTICFLWYQQWRFLVCLCRGEIHECITFSMMAGNNIYLGVRQQIPKLI